jgi:hypothetical protein
LYILGLIGYQGALTVSRIGLDGVHHIRSLLKPLKPLTPLTPLTPLLPQFWTAAFPGLARDLPEVKESEEKLARHEIEWVHVVFIVFIDFHPGLRYLL